MTAFRIVIELMRYRPRRFAVSALLWSIMHGSPVVFGYLIGRIFDELTGEATVASNPWVLVAIYAAIALGRNLVLWMGEVLWIDYWLEQSLQLRRNMLRWLLEAPGSRVIEQSTGRAISTFRDDVDDVMEYLETYVDSGGFVIFGLGSLGVMASIDTGLTVVLLVPLLLTLALTQAFVPEIRRRRREMRSATEAVTGYVGELFGGVQSIKLAGAADSMLEHFRSLNEHRRHKALRDVFLTEALRSINHNMASIAVAITLIAVSARVGSPEFTIGDLTVFLVYLPRLASQMAWIGNIFAQHRRAGVAFERIETTTVDAPPTAILDRTTVQFSDRSPTVVHHAIEDRFERLQIRDLRYVHPDGELGLEGVDLDVERGEFVVLTGKIGSGKSLVLRGLLGLVPTSGEIRWNGQPVDDPASFFIPPRTAYTPQVPRLFSDTLANNISFGRSMSGHDLMRAARLAVLEDDIDRLERGYDTMVGARGVKLSGGQMQRSAAARMFATGADLLVFDDLSSALDVETEARLWSGIFESGSAAAALVVSHRRPALRRADRIYVMDRGTVAAVGTLDEVLEASALMRELWTAGQPEEMR